MIINFTSEVTPIKVFAWKGKKHNRIQWFRVWHTYLMITFCGDFVSPGQREANRTVQSKSPLTVMWEITVYALSPDCLSRHTLLTKKEIKVIMLHILSISCDIKFLFPELFWALYISWTVNSFVHINRVAAEWLWPWTCKLEALPCWGFEFYRWQDFVVVLFTCPAPLDWQRSSEIMHDIHPMLQVHRESKII